jgi:SinI-like restriction endonuclease
MLSLTKRSVIAYAKKSVHKQGYKWNSEFESILNFCFESPQCFTKKGKVELKKNTPASDVRTYIDACVRSYFNALARNRSLEPVKTQPDPAVDTVLKAFEDVANKDILKEMSITHRVCMGAENILGDLLELYVAGALRTEGWIWCPGNVLRAVDFLRPGKPNELLQIKNRDNSENSSSSAIRKFLHDQGSPLTIRKWHRISSRDSKTFWELLPGNEKSELASETGFHKFIEVYAKKVRAKDKAAKKKAG